MATGTWGDNLGVHPIRVRIRFALGNEQCQTGFNLRKIGTQFVTMESIAADVGTWVNTSFRNILSIEDRLIAVDAVDVVNKEGAEVVYNNIFGTANQSGGRAPSILQIPVSMKSGLRARYGQGRAFWPIVTEAFTDGNVMTGAARTLFQTQLDALFTKYVDQGVTDGLRMINFHGPLAAGRGEPSATPKPAVPASWYDVTSLRLGIVIGALRSRKQGIGA